MMGQILYCLLIVSAAQMGMDMPVRALSTECPTVTVDCPTEFTGYDVPVTFKANVNDADPKATLTYKWSVSTGTILSGQGTSTVIVDLVGTEGQSITATVEVGGLDSSCVNAASCSMICTLPPQSRKFDEYGDIALKDEKVRLDSFAIQLHDQPGAQAYIIAYDRRAGEARARADHAKKLLVSYYKIDPQRIVTVYGGVRKSREVELWIVPAGAQPPQPTPTAASPDEVQKNKVSRFSSSARAYNLRRS